MPLKEDVSWVYINGLGEREPENISESDTLTSITFDGTGDYLAVGDRAGRVIVFKHSGPIKNSLYFDYRYFAEI
jgi:serine/threonine-protein phosphatase 2A regulatory subunit B